VLVTEAADRFTTLLRAVRGDPERPEPQATWRAFKQFAGEEIEQLSAGSDRDRLLFEAGPSRYGPCGAPAFMVEFERQYEAGGGPEYEGMLSVLCSFAFPVGEDLDKAAGVQLWGTPGPAAADWIAAVESSSPFALLERAPTHATLDAGPI
jgi:hypothetical protein